MLVPLLALALLTSPALAQDWTLVWSDEFDGPTIDFSKWSHEVNGAGGGNNELQYYTDRTNNSFISNGALVIQALEEEYTGPDGTRDYTSARLRTLNKGDWEYGRFEARIKLPTGQGLWPAFWMLPTDWVYGGWAASGEIDIMENVGHETSRVHGTLHYGGPWPNNTYSGASYDLPSGTVYSSFHTYAVEWEPGEIRWYVDGVHYQTQTSWYSTAAAYPAPFNQRFHLLLNVAVGGDWPGSPNGSTSFPQRMEVDYVRVYQASTDLGPPTVIAATGTTTLQAEDYATGGAGHGYHDTDSGNNGNAYRSDDVDIEVTTDIGGGHNVGWIAAGEWLMFPVDVQVPGYYTPGFRVASPGGGTFRLLSGPVDLTGVVTVPATGGWQNWTTVAFSDVWLTPGAQNLRFYTETGNFNFNWLALLPPPPDNDIDGDGMIDTWEFQHHGNPTSFLAGADQDLDGAGNLEEYIADTDPDDPASRMKVMEFNQGSNLQLSVWPASTNRRYRLQLNTGPDGEGPWSDEATGLVPTGTIYTITHPLPTGATVRCRIGVELPPGP